MTNSLICGMTCSGKTTLAVSICHDYMRAGFNTVVLDPLLDPRWGSDVLTTDPVFFLAIATHPESSRLALFIDESGEMIGHYNDEMFILATRIRHKGHNSHFITQRVKAISPTVRTQCEFLFMFNSNVDDATELSKDFNRPELKTANILRQGEYFKYARFGSLEKLSIF